MKRVFIALLVVSLCLIGAQFAMAAGEKAYTPSNNDLWDLGTDNLQYKDVHMGGDIYIEGPTHDAYELKITATDPTADRTATFPNSSGTVAYTDSTLTGTFTGTVNGTILDTTDANVLISNGVKFQSKTVSGDITFANTGAATIGNNKIGTAEAYLNTVSVTIASSGTSGTATVTSGSTLLGAPYGFANVHDTAYNGVTNAGISGTTLTVLINGTAGANAVVYKAVVLEP